ncbi:MAG: hypothetical protein KOO63_12095 [Bacteroidales bacterium]|nr:hypothetical protein [Candidatus Latescibacterota bacterium]
MSNQKISNFSYYLILILTLCIPNAYSQELSFSLSLTTDSGTVPQLLFGVRDDAFSGLDKYDIPEPPAAPGSLLHVFLAMQSPPLAFPNRWHSDIRSLSEYQDKRLEIWNMTVESNQTGGEGLISIESNSTQNIPFKLQVQGPGGLFEVVNPPCTVTFPVSAPVISFYWILEVDDQVHVRTETWGGVKSLFR